MTNPPDTPMFTVYIPCETIHEDDVVVARCAEGGRKSLRNRKGAEVTSDAES